MKRKVLCIALALVMCLMVAVPAIADGEAETPPARVDITASFGLKHVSGSQYKIWAKIVNPNEATVFVTLALYDASYSLVKAVGTVSADQLITLVKGASLSSGTYHLRLTITVNGFTNSGERTYNI